MARSSSKSARGRRAVCRAGQLMKQPNGPHRRGQGFSRRRQLVEGNCSAPTLRAPASTHCSEKPQNPLGNIPRFACSSGVACHNAQQGGDRARCGRTSTKTRSADHSCRGAIPCLFSPGSSASRRVFADSQYGQTKQPKARTRLLVERLEDRQMTEHRPWE